MSQPYPPYGSQPYPAAQGYGAYPGAGYPAPVGAPPESNMVWAVLTTIFCFMPLGIVSIIKAAEVNSKWASGDFAGAYRSSEEAKKWAKWSAIVTVIAYVLIIAFYALMVFGILATVGIGASTYPDY